MKAQERPALRQHCVSRQQGQVGETRVCRHRGRRERANGVKNEKPSRRRERGEGGGERRVTHTHTHTHTLSLSVADEEKGGRRERRMLEYGVSKGAGVGAILEGGHREI